MTSECSEYFHGNGPKTFQPNRGAGCSFRGLNLYCNEETHAHKIFAIIAADAGVQKDVEASPTQFSSCRQTAFVETNMVNCVQTCASYEISGHCALLFVMFQHLLDLHGFVLDKNVVTITIWISTQTKNLGFCEFLSSTPFAPFGWQPCFPEKNVGIFGGW